MSSQKPSSNDQRSNVKNPNNPAHEADEQNRQRQVQGNAPQPASQPQQQAPKK